jgi:hypothetical protein
MVASARWAISVFILVGITFAISTPKSGRISPIIVQLMVVVAIVTFFSIGYWTMLWQPAADRVGAAFVIGGLVGAAVYACATYSNLADVDGLPGSSTVGWFGDLVFLPAIAALSPAVLVYVANRGRSAVDVGRKPLLAGRAAGVVLFVAALIEPYVLTNPDVRAPFAASEDVWKSLIWLGVGLGAIALVGAFLILRGQPGAANASHWYEYGGMFALATLVPYLAVTLSPWTPAIPGGRVVARASVIGLAVVAISSLPATLDEPWRSGRMRRLVRAAAIAAAAAALHTVMVHNAVDNVIERGGAETALGGQTVLAYELTLIVVAILLEPFNRGFDHVTERLIHRLSPPSDLLEEALDDLREARSRLERAIVRAERLAGIGMVRARAETRQPEARRRPLRLRWRRHRSEDEIRKLIEEIRAEQSQADNLIDRIASEVQTLNL